MLYAMSTISTTVLPSYQFVRSSDNDRPLQDDNHHIACIRSPINVAISQSMAE